jgi:LmbE family N-acetylglucosaminyl deacetylase
MKSIFSYTFLLVFMFVGFLGAQVPKEQTSTEIFQAIQKLQFLGSVLYVAAHPDDENTRVISYMSNQLKANTAYLSLTRGDGGQNRIGPEIREQLGLIRTHELLEARKIDGGKQFFTRANDFGYSKHPDETFSIWNKEEVMADVIWVIRKFRPDVIINRFDHRTPGRTHGHHTGSAMLSYEAFDMTNNKSVYPSQLEFVDTWQPTRLFFNTSWWFYGSRENFEKADKSKLVSMDVGVYYPLKGKSNTEIAAESRTMHKSQAFGSTGTRGSHKEYLELLKGDMPEDPNNLFEGINTSWSRVKGGAPIGDLLKSVEMSFNFENPAQAVPKLIEAKKLIQSIQDERWKEIKLAEIDKIIADCLGLYIEAIANDYTAIPGDSIDLRIEATNRSAQDVRLEKIQWGQSLEKDSIIELSLSENKANFINLTYQIPNNQEFSNPYWLKSEGTYGLYNVDNQELIGLPRLEDPLQVVFHLNILGNPFTISKDLLHKKNDAVKGAVYRPFEIIPAISVEMVEGVYIFSDQNPRRVQVELTAGKNNVSGDLTLVLPDDWRSMPDSIPFQLTTKGESLEFEFELFPPQVPSTVTIMPKAWVGGQAYFSKVDVIEYDHIPIQTLTTPSSSKLVNIDLKKAGTRVLYIQGSGDAIPESLEQVGYTVDIIEAHEISSQLLQTYDACILGIRAYNLFDELKFKQSILLNYVNDGGTMIVQYNTTRGIKVEDIGPYPLKLSRERVAAEDAPIRILAPEHSVLNYPNKITSEDFENWVQERGLYFSNEWDDKYTSILSSNDPGETPKNGGLLVAEYGDGYYVYTGYSWFRQLPAGVPGAYRLFTNLISLGNVNKP